MTTGATDRRTRQRWRSIALITVLVVVLFGDAVALRVARRVEATLRPARARTTVPDSLGPLVPVALGTSDGLTLRGWYVRSRNGAAVLLAHGHGGQRAQLAAEASALARRGYGVLMFDARAHGASDGDRTTWGVDEQRDIDGARAFLAAQPDVDSTRIGAVGFSMGAMTVAMVAARDRRLRAVVLEGAFTSVEAMFRHDEDHYGWWSGRAAVAALRRRGVPIDRVRPIDVICKISPRPVLIVNGAEDVDTPVATARALYAAACPPKSIWIIPGATHLRYASAGAELARRLGEFFDWSLAASPSARADR